MNGFVKSKLRPWQVAPAAHLLDILRDYDSALDSSDTGTGKTYTAVAVACSLGLPTLVVCPKISVSMWHSVAAHFNDSLSVINYESLRTGKTPFGSWQNQRQVESGRSFVFLCQCCQRRIEFEKPHLPCFTNGHGIHCVDRKPRPIVYGPFQFNQAVRLVLFDESHRCSGINSLNSEILVAAKRQRIKHLMLSATPAQNILQMRALGYSLDLHKDGPDFYRWLSRHGARRDPVFKGIKWFKSAEQQRVAMAEIRSQIIPARGVRITTDEIPGFPEVDIQAQLFDIENAEHIDKLYEEMSEALFALETASGSDVAPESAITKILRARQKIELLKVPAAIEIAQDRLEQGFSIGFFVNFRQTVEAISTRMRCPFIDGTVTGKARDEIISSYQSNSIRSLVLNSEAAGISIGLQDLDGEHPRIGLVSPPWSATIFKQLVGRFPRDGGKSKSHFRVMFAAGTIEVQMYRALSGKLNNLSALCDGDLQPENLCFSK